MKVTHLSVPSVLSIRSIFSVLSVLLFFIFSYFPSKVTWILIINNDKTPSPSHFVSPRLGSPLLPLTRQQLLLHQQFLLEADHLPVDLLQTELVSPDLVSIGLHHPPGEPSNHRGHRKQ